MGVEQEHVQGQLPDELAEALVEQAYVVTLAHHASDVVRLDAGRHEIDSPWDSGIEAGRHVVSGLGDVTAAPQILVERVAHRFLAPPEQGVDPGGLDVGVDDPDVLALGGQQCRHVGRSIRLAGAPAERMDRDDPRHRPLLCISGVGLRYGSGRRRSSEALAWRSRKYSVWVISATCRAARASSISMRSCRTSCFSICSRARTSVAIRWKTRASWPRASPRPATPSSCLLSNRPVSTSAAAAATWPTCSRYSCSRSCRRFLASPALILARSSTGSNGLGR